MKTIYIAILLLFAWTTVRAEGDSVFVRIQGDTVNIWNTKAVINCCFRMVIDLAVANDSIVFTERDSSQHPIVCNCVCTFDFTASLTGLPSQMYHVYVYRKLTVPDTLLFIGSTSFNIGLSTSSFKIIREHQSVCGGDAVRETPMDRPGNYSLDNNYPNPFNPTTTIRYVLPVRSNVRLVVFDVLGRVIDVMMNEVQDQGEKEIEWNTLNKAGGVYFYRLDAAGVAEPTKHFNQTRSMILMK